LPPLLLLPLPLPLPLSTVASPIMGWASAAASASECWIDERSFEHVPLMHTYPLAQSLVCEHAPPAPAGDAGELQAGAPRRPVSPAIAAKTPARAQVEAETRTRFSLPAICR
jgi:hypothetical protein